jgi:hypothetical protein
MNLSDIENLAQVAPSQLPSLSSTASRSRIDNADVQTGQTLLVLVGQSAWYSILRDNSVTSSVFCEIKSLIRTFEYGFRAWRILFATRHTDGYR